MVSKIISAINNLIEEVRKLQAILCAAHDLTIVEYKQGSTVMGYFGIKASERTTQETLNLIDPSLKHVLERPQGSYFDGSYIVDTEGNQYVLFSPAYPNHRHLSYGECAHIATSLAFERECNAKTSPK